MASFGGYGTAMVLLMSVLSPVFLASPALAECVGSPDAYAEVCTPGTTSTEVDAFTVKPGNGSNCIEPLGNETPGLCLYDDTVIVTTVTGPSVKLYGENLFEDVCLVVNQVAPGTCQASNVMGYTDADGDGVFEGVVFETSQGPLHIPADTARALAPS